MNVHNYIGSFIFDLKNIGAMREDREPSITVKIETKIDDVAAAEEAAEAHGLELIGAEEDGSWAEDEAMLTFTN